MKQVQQELPAWVRPLGGAVGGATEILCLMPLDVTKTRLQLGGYKGFLDCGRTIARDEGAKALWKGLTPLMVQQSIKYAVRHSVFQAAKQALFGTRGETNVWYANLVSGLCAGLFEALAIVTPFEVPRQPLTTRP